MLLQYTSLFGGPPDRMSALVVAADKECTAPFKLGADGAPFGVLFVARPGAEITLLRVM